MLKSKTIEISRDLIKIYALILVEKKDVKDIYEKKFSNLGYLQYKEILENPPF